MYYILQYIYMLYFFEACEWVFPKRYSHRLAELRWRPTRQIKQIKNRVQRRGSISNKMEAPSHLAHQ
jgi:hypothetical protein